MEAGLAPDAHRRGLERAAHARRALRVLVAGGGSGENSTEVARPAAQHERRARIGRVGIGDADGARIEPAVVVHRAAQPAAGAQAPLQADAPFRTLLYVEDNPANVMLVEELIARRPDIRLLSARDGVSGVEMARASQPDVILLDINLPGISGLQVLEILAAAPSTARIPVVALSAHAMPRDIENGLAAGFFRYLTKPIKINEFMDTLDAALKFSQTAAKATTAGAAK